MGSQADITLWFPFFLFLLCSTFVREQWAVATAMAGVHRQHTRYHDCSRHREQDADGKIEPRIYGTRFHYFLLLLLLRAFPFSLELIILNRFLNSIERKFSRLPSLSSSSLLRIICVQRRLKLMATSADFSYFMRGAWSGLLPACQAGIISIIIFVIHFSWMNELCFCTRDKRSSRISNRRGRRRKIYMARI